MNERGIPIPFTSANMVRTTRLELVMRFLPQGPKPCALPFCYVRIKLWYPTRDSNSENRPPQGRASANSTSGAQLNLSKNKTWRAVSDSNRRITGLQPATLNHFANDSFGAGKGPRTPKHQLLRKAALPICLSPQNKTPVAWRLGSILFRLNLGIYIPRHRAHRPASSKDDE